MLVQLEQGGGPVVITVRPWARLLARLRAARLDADLARGAPPDGSIELALRARTLARTSTRRELARGAQRALTVSMREPAFAGMPVPLRRDQVLACSRELTELIERLLADGPVSARGMAQARTLLADGTGPLYRRTSADELRAAIRSAADAVRAV